MIHECMGQKYVVTSKVWTKNESGIYGYKSKKQTKYRCRFRGVTKSNDRKVEEGVEKMTKITSSLGEGMDSIIVGNTAIHGLCGGTNTGAGANKSESLQDQSRTQENG